MRQVRLIVNPIAGKGHGVDVVPTLEACLRRLRYQPFTFVTRRRGDALNFAASVDWRTSLILVVGGDGTLHEVINGQTKIPLALFPMGTGNPIAGDLGIQGRVDFLEGLLRNGVVERFDLGDARGTKFVGGAACGILGEIHRRFWEQRKGPDNIVRCCVRALKVLRRKKFPPLTVWCDGKLITRSARIAVISNTRTYAPSIRFTPMASPMDGVFDVCTFPEPSRLDLIKWLLGILRQRHLDYDGIYYVRGRTIRVAGEGVACCVDGEYIGQGPLTFSVLPRSVPILVPAVPGVRRTGRRGQTPQESLAAFSNAGLYRERTLTTGGEIDVAGKEEAEAMDHTARIRRGRLDRGGAFDACRSCEPAGAREGDLR